MAEELFRPEPPEAPPARHPQDPAHLRPVHIPAQVGYDKVCRSCSAYIGGPDRALCGDLPCLQRQRPDGAHIYYVRIEEEKSNG